MDDNGNINGNVVTIVLDGDQHTHEELEHDGVTEEKNEEAESNHSLDEVPPFPTSRDNQYRRMLTPPSPIYVFADGGGGDGDGDGDGNVIDPFPERTPSELADYTLDGVPWGGHYQHKRKFELAFQEALRSVPIAGSEKLNIMERYVKLTCQYKWKRKKWKLLSGFARVAVTVGSIIIPALITLDDEIRERSTTSQAIAYTVFSIGLLVSIINGLQELFSATQRFITVGTTEELLVAEGWAFISLSGRYRRYEHSECWRHFLNRTEKIHAAAVNATMALTRRPADDAVGPTTPSVGRPNSTNGGFNFNDDRSSEAPVVYANH